jgi:ketosteroid isomerase-like protein
VPLKGSEKDIAALKGMLEVYVGHFNKGDFEEWMALWNKNAVQMMHSVPATVGVDAIRKVMSPIFKNYTVEITINEILDVEVDHGFGLTRCNYTMKLKDSKGKRVPGIPDGKTLTIYARQPDGSWEITYDCSNSNSRRIIFPEN